MNMDRAALPAATREVASWVAQLDYAQTCPSARAKSCAARCSTRSAAVSTATRRRGRRCCSTGRGQGGGKAEATVWGEAAPSLRASDAALVNGTSIHAFELDDYHQAKLHPGAVVIPAAIAMAEKLGCDRRAARHRDRRRLRSDDPLEPRARSFRRAAARLAPHRRVRTVRRRGGVRVLMGLDEERTAWALGLAGTQGAGLWAFNADGTMSKRLHAGRPPIRA